MNALNILSAIIAVALLGALLYFIYKRMTRPDDPILPGRGSSNTQRNRDTRNL